MANSATTTVGPKPMYSHSIEVPVGHRLLVISGQLGIDENGSIPDDAEALTALCLAAIEKLLKKSGLGRSDVLKLNGYVADRAHLGAYAKVRNDWASSLAILPCSTLVVVSGFVRPEFLVEIEAIASKAC